MYDAPRKRLLPSNNETISVNLIEALDDSLDPDFLELLKEYDEDDRDEHDEDKERALQRQRSERPPYLTQGTIYISMLVGIVLFIYLINYFNMKQLERLKEEYGMDEKKVVPEIWWRKALIYHIYVRSFKDSDGNGIGDLNGIRESIHHVDYVGATAVLLSGFYPSPAVHFGKDVSDFKGIDKNCGTMEDFNKLVEELHAMGMKVLIEVTPNHTSKRHRWFVESRRTGVNNKYKKYYVWDSGNVLENGTKVPPNNWLSRYGGSAWTWDEERMQYYYHHYHYSMPDLNHRDPGVREELMTIFEFWLEKQVDGLLIDGTHVMFESDDVLLDESTSEKEGVKPGEYEYLDHIYTEDHPDVHEFLSVWREHIDNYAVKSNRKIGLLVDVVDETIKDVMKYYHTGADVPVCHSLTQLREMECDGRCIHDLVDNWIAQVPEEKDPLWMLSSPFYQRMKRGGDMKYQPLMNMLIMLLPGAAITYYGEELGMPGQSGQKRPTFVGGLPYNLRWAITPMQWTGDPGAGFTSGDPWLAPHETYRTINAENQKVIMELPKYSPSPLQQYQKLARIRQQTSFVHGKLQYSVITNNVFSFMRYAKDSAPYLVAMNFGSTSETNDFSMSTGVQYGKVVVHVTGDIDPSGHIVDGGKVNLLKLSLEPGEGVVALLLMDIEFSL